MSIESLWPTNQFFQNVWKSFLLFHICIKFYLITIPIKFGNIGNMIKKCSASDIFLSHNVISFNHFLKFKIPHLLKKSSVFFINKLKVEVKFSI